MAININGIAFGSKDSQLFIKELQKYQGSFSVTENIANKYFSGEGASIFSFYDNINPVAEIEKDKCYYICFDTVKIDDLNSQNKIPYKKEIFKFKTDNKAEIERFSVLCVTSKILILDLERTGQSKWSKARSATPAIIKQFEDLVKEGYLIESTRFIKTQNGHDTFEVKMIKIDK